MNKLTFVSIAALAAVTVLLHSSSCQAASANQLDNLKNQLLPAEYRNTNLTIDDAKRVLIEKCKKASGGVVNATLYQDIEKSATKLMGCLSTIANVTAIQEEIEVARPIGELDTVFQKYCSKAPEAELCLREFNKKLQPCLSEAEKQQNTITMRVISSLMTFMCHKGGNQIALFVAEEGPECLEANKEAIAHCANSSFAEYVPKDGSVPNLFDLPELILSPEHCMDFERFEACTLHHLEQCQEITPANVAHSVFKFIKNETSCLPIINAKANERSVLRDPRAGGSERATTTLGLLVAMVAGLLVMLQNNLL